MKTLDEIRNEIDSLDEMLRELLLARFSLSQDVAASKKDSGTPIYRPEREQEIIRKITKDLDGEVALKIASLFRSFMLLSRELQYSILLGSSDAFCPAFDRYVKKRPAAEDPQVVCYQGLPGAYSHAAAMKMYPSAVYKNVSGFEDIFDMVSKGEASCGILPLENSTAGIVSEVYDLLMRYSLFINRSSPLLINHVLLACPGSSRSSVRRVFSHPHALSQCSAYLKNAGYEIVPVSNTAVAAKIVSELKSTDTAAVASETMAEIYGLCVIGQDIANERCNYTRFISISRMLYQNALDNQISIAFNLPHQSGTLASALSIFSDYGLNLSSIQSRPRPDTPFEYSFYADFDGNLSDHNTRAVLFQLERELPMLKILGTYRKSGDL